MRRSADGSAPDGSAPDRRTRRRGAAALEYALIAPALLAVVFAMIDYGWWFLQHERANQVLIQAMRSGGLIVPDLGEPRGECANCLTRAAALAQAGLEEIDIDVDAEDVTPELVSVGGSCTLVLDVELEFHPLVGLVLTPEHTHHSVTELAQGVLGC